MHLKSLIPAILGAVLPLTAGGATYEYAYLLISESHNPEAGELLVRLDSASGNEFFCREKYKNSEDMENNAWPACIVSLGKKVSPVRATDLATTGRLTFEPLTLSLFGRRGWEVISVTDSEIKGGKVYIKDRRFLMKLEGK